MDSITQTPSPSKKNLVLTPLKIECDKLILAFKDLGFTFKTETYNKKTIYISNEIPLIITWAAHGKVNFALHTQDLVLKLKSSWDIKAILCCGSSGALIEDLNIGDVVLGQKTIEHDYKNSFNNFKLLTFEADKTLLQFLKTNTENLNQLIKIELDNIDHNSISQTKNNLYLGIIASGDEDVLSMNRAQELHNKTSAHAVAWEGAGGAKASKLLNLPFLEIRSITDLCNENTPQDFQKNLSLCMHNLAFTLQQLFSKDELTEAR